MITKELQVNNIVKGVKINKIVNYNAENESCIIDKNQTGRIAYFLHAVDMSQKLLFADIEINAKGVITCAAVDTNNNVIIEDTNNTLTRCTTVKYKGQRTTYTDIFKALSASDATDNTQGQASATDNAPELTKDQKYIVDNYATIISLDCVHTDNMIIFTDPSQLKNYGIDKTFVMAADMDAAEKYIAIETARKEAERIEAERKAKEAEENAAKDRKEAEERAKGLRPEAAKALALATAAKKCNRGLAVYLWGEAGTGKSTMIGDIANNLDLPLYTQSCVFNEFELFGFVDGSGNYQETAFYKAFTDGGVFLLDEMDCSDICSLKKLNGAIANNVYCFPGVGTKRAHKNFYCFATGNTIGKPSAEYTGAQLIDVSTMDRFFAIEVKYNEEIETTMATAAGQKDVAEFVQDLRRSALQTKTNIVVSFRLTLKLITCREAGLSDADALESCLMSYIDTATAHTLGANLKNKNSEYAKRLNK